MVNKKKKSVTEELVMYMLSFVDYDIMKAYDPKTAEEPDYAAEQLADLIKRIEKKFVIEKKK